MIQRGDVYDVEFPGAGAHPAVVVTREQAISVLPSVAVVLVTSTVRGHPAEVGLNPSADLDITGGSVVNCDDIATVPKRRLGRHRGRLGPAELGELNTALTIALGLD